MAHPFKHAESSARKFGGKAEDYLPVHNWLALIWTVQRRERSSFGGIIKVIALVQPTAVGRDGGPRVARAVVSSHNGQHV